MSDHLRGKVELWACARLNAAVAGLLAVPSDGDEGIVPPYAVATAEEDSAETVADMTSVMNLDIIYATSIHDTPTADHSAQYKNIQLALRAMPVGDFPELGLIISGAQQPPGEVSGQSVSGDQAHGDVVSLAVAATDMGESLSGAELVATMQGRTLYTLLGDGSARSFTVSHLLPAGVSLAALVLRDAGAGGTVHVLGRDYRSTLAVADDPTSYFSASGSTGVAAVLTMALGEAGMDGTFTIAVNGGAAQSFTYGENTVGNPLHLNTWDAGYGAYSPTEISINFGDFIADNFAGVLIYTTDGVRATLTTVATGTAASIAVTITGATPFLTGTPLMAHTLALELPEGRLATPGTGALVLCFVTAR